MSAIKKLAGETVIYGIPSIVGRFLNWWLTPLYCLMFIPSEYGILSNILAYVALLQVILTYGMETSYFRFAGRGDHPERVYVTSMVSLIITSIVFIGFVAAFLPSIANWLGYPAHPEFILWMAVTVIMDAICSIPFAKLRLESKAIRFATFKTFNIALSIILNIFWIYLCPKILSSNPNSIIRYIYDPSIGIGYAFLAYLVSSVVTLLLFFPELKFPKGSFDFPLLKRMLNYGWPILVIGVAGMVNLNIDKILLPKLLPQEQNPIFELGVYSASSKLAILMTLFIQAFRFSFEPFVFSHYKNDDSKAVYAVIMKYFVILGLLIFLGVMFYMDILKFFIGSAKSGYHEGIKVVPWLLMGNLFLGIFYTQSLWYKLTDQTHFGARFAIIGALITVVLNVLFIPSYGYMASGYAFFLASLIMTINSYVVGQKYFPINYNLRRIGLYFFAAILLYSLSLLLTSRPLILKVGFNTLLLALFFLLIYVKEKSDLKRLFKPKGVVS